MMNTNELKALVNDYLYNESTSTKESEYLRLLELAFNDRNAFDNEVSEMLTSME